MLHESWIPAYAGMTTFYEVVIFAMPPFFDRLDLGVRTKAGSDNHPVPGLQLLKLQRVQVFLVCLVTRVG